MARVEDLACSKRGLPGVMTLPGTCTGHILHLGWMNLYSNLAFIDRQLIAMDNTNHSNPTPLPSHLSSTAVSNEPNPVAAPIPSDNQTTVTTPSRRSIPARPRATGRRRRHTTCNNHIEFMFYRYLRQESEDEEGEVEQHDEDDDEDDEDEELGQSAYQRQSVPDIHQCDVIVLKTDNGWCFDQDIFLPAWKRDEYEATNEEGEEHALNPPELVKVDEIRLD